MIISTTDWQRTNYKIPKCAYNQLNCSNTIINQILKFKIINLNFALTAIDCTSKLITLCFKLTF